MQLQRTNVSFNKTPFLTVPIDEELVKTLKLRDFDKDGYEIPTPLERLYYEAQGVNLNKEIQYHIAPVEPWYIDTEDSEQGLVLDHSMLLTRWEFAGEAREQLLRHLKDRPILNKLLGIKHKWGLDFSLDWVDENGCTEVIHIEQDFRDYNLACETKQQVEQLIETTDWIDGVRQLFEHKQFWKDLNSDDHSHWKARFFGWHKAFDSLKVFSS